RMNDSSTPDTGTADDAEPNLTSRNSMTIRGEEILAHDEAGEIETSTRTADRVIPTSYGAAGGMTPDTDEN
ncbi:MAG: hypothetical protein ABI186_04945, partial [Candidatus Elarobacter sp.]